MSILYYVSLRVHEIMTCVIGLLLTTRNWTELCRINMTQ